ncbi:hypothetical protein EDD15DRAFT_2359872 [Pisolithus albus]|nr:hypothetical protein EDD15DRAFT_2359872 [Pisolithus albus]
MNQPRGRCITSQLRIKSSETPFSGADGDAGDWIDMDSGFDGLADEVFDVEMETRTHEPVTELYSGASANYGRGYTFMDAFDADPFSSERQHNLFYPFSSGAEWKFASWLANSGLSMATIDECLSLDVIKSQRFSFKTAKALRKLIELLPSGPRWKCRSVKTESPTRCALQVFYRDAIECLQHLIHSPSNNGLIHFVPEKIYSAADRTQRIYTDWLTGDRAWELQDALPDGATLLGIVLSSDKTHITQVGNRQAHPLLISLANISADVCRKGSTKSYVLLALLPVPWFVHPNKRLRGVLASRLLHQVISVIVKPLKMAAEVGRMMSDPVGNLKYCFTPLVAYIADTPEQHVIACVTDNASAVSMAVSNQFGDPLRCAARTMSKTRQLLIAVKRETRARNLSSYFQACRKRQLNGVASPFWLDWALVEPSSFLTPEVLHHFFKMFWDHDRKCGYQHFPDGITTLKQTSMRLHQEVQRYIVGVVAGGIPQGALTAIRALTDFRYRSQAPKLTDADIAKLTASLQEFHNNKAALMEAGARGSMDHWRIPKLEIMLSVVPSIRSMGALGQWSADVTEHAHIDVIKDPARSGNNQNFDGQICCYLDRQEKCQLFMQATTARYLDLRGDSDDSDPSDGEENMLGSRQVTDYFKRAHALSAGDFPTAPRPYRTFASSTTTFHLASRPKMTNIDVDRAAELYGLPDFKPAMADYLARHHHNLTHTIGGRWRATPDCQLPFDHIQIWSKIRIQSYSSYDLKMLLLSQGLHVSPPTVNWPFGRYDSIIISRDGNKDWLHSGLHGHDVVQLRMIFKPILGSQSLLSNMYYAYVQRCVTTSVDQHAGMHVLKRALRSTGERVGDIIPLFQICVPAHLIPRFGQKANSQLNSHSSDELSSSFWLNKYWTKELFHACS